MTDLPEWPPPPPSFQPPGDPASHERECLEEAKLGAQHFGELVHDVHLEGEYPDTTLVIDVAPAKGREPVRQRWQLWGSAHLGHVGEHGTVDPGYVEMFVRHRLMEFCVDPELRRRWAVNPPRPAKPPITEPPEWPPPPPSFQPPGDPASHEQACLEEAKLTATTFDPLIHDVRLEGKYPLTELVIDVAMAEGYEPTRMDWPLWGSVDFGYVGKLGTASPGEVGMDIDIQLHELCVLPRPREPSPDRSSDTSPAEDD